MVADAMLSQFDRLPPHSVADEMCLLASMMLDEKMIPLVRAVVTRDAFFQVDHQIIFDAICGLYDNKKNIDPMVLRSELERRGVLDEVGGPVYIGEMITCVPSAAHGVMYAETVREKWLRRSVISLANDILRKSYGPGHLDAPGEMIQDAMAKLARLAQTRAGGSERIGEMVMQAAEQMNAGGVPLITTGYRELDELVGGFGIGEMWLIGGRPSMGKSTLAKQMALRAAMAGVPSAIFSLEESNPKIARNILSAESRIENGRLRSGVKLATEEWTKIYAAVGRLESVPLFSIDRLRRLSDIHAEAAMLVQRHGVKLIVVDYLQRIQAGGKDKYEQVGNASQGLSDLIKDLRITGVIPVQLNRSLESRDDKRPTMSDLRDSGQIEQDADGIAFLHREDYYHTDDKEYIPSGEAEVIIAKNRDGIRGRKVVLKSNLKYQTFEDRLVDPWEADNGRN